MNKMYLVLGDWSGDGHGKSDKILVEVNKTVKEVQDAYKASCRLTGVSFNHNDDFTCVKRKYDVAHKYLAYTEYEGSELSKEVEEVFEKFGLVEDWEAMTLEDGFVPLWFSFVKLSLPDLEYNIVKDDIPCINGYWDDNLNVQFAYGLYE